MNVSNGKDKTGINSKIIDYDIHGIVGVRLINPTANDAAAVAEQLDQHRRPLKRKPDITIRFTEKLSTPSLTYLGLDAAGYTDEGFYIFSKKENAKVRIPFDKIGDRCEILCESGVHSVPWLLEMINFTFIAKNYIPLHAAAFEYEGVGVLVTGWTKGGKTEALLAFANHGANYVGDEWVIVSGDGKTMFGMPVPICVWEWYFKELAELLPKIGLQRKILFKSIHFLDTISGALNQGGSKKSLLSNHLNKALPHIKKQLNIRVLPKVLFNNRICSSTSFDKLFFSLSHNHPEINVDEYEPGMIAKRMIESNICEQAPFLEMYRTFKFAFPDLYNEFLEIVEEIQYSLLLSAFENKEAYKVVHPYPIPLQEYFHQLRPLCKKSTEILL